MLKTFGDIQKSRVIQVASADPTSDDFLSLVNSATRQLMTRGNWWGTVQPMQGCVFGNCVTWPRYVESILALDVCGHHTIPANRWYRFTQWDEQVGQWARRWRDSGSRYVTDSDGTMPVFNPIPCGHPMTIRFYVDNALDAGKTIRIYGLDSNNQPLTGARPDGTVQDGLVITLAVPYASSPMALNRIDRVVKDVTLGRVRGYQVDTNGVLYDLCIYEASETSPDYVRTRIPGQGCCRMIMAMVKLAFVPVVFPDDLVLIENEDALRDMIISIKRKEAGDLAGSRAMEVSAFRELNYELKNRMPDEQFRVDFQPFGNDTLERQKIGMMQ